MINLFSVPKDIINLGKYTNILHDKCVQEFEEIFADYVGANYACSASSASDLIKIILFLFPTKFSTVRIPTIIPNVVPSYILHSRHDLQFYDNTAWVGNSYTLHTYENFKLTDSAQKVEAKQCKYAITKDMTIFSFYPTKPVGSLGGGMVVSNDREKIEKIRQATLYGKKDGIVEYAGWRSFMSAPQADIARKSLERLQEKQFKIKRNREYLNSELGLNNTSNHLYCIDIDNRNQFRRYMQERNIMTGVHYPCMHAVFSSEDVFPESEKWSRRTVSIPFHEDLGKRELDHILLNIREW